tara:strand:- start:5 stop:286 length:282 start_codon:yes stop_codon:yes gene_type:complete
MNWFELCKNTDKESQMYGDAAMLINNLSEIGDESFALIKDFAAAYDDMLDKEPIEWPLMHDYLLKVSERIVEERKLHVRTLKEIKREILDEDI